jgi:hypothetical protein
MSTKIKPNHKQRRKKANSSGPPTASAGRRCSAYYKPEMPMENSTTRMATQSSEPYVGGLRYDSAQSDLGAAGVTVAQKHKSPQPTASKRAKKPHQRWHGADAKASTQACSGKTSSLPRRPAHSLSWQVVLRHACQHFKTPLEVQQARVINPHCPPATKHHHPSSPNKHVKK